MPEQKPASAAKEHTPTATEMAAVKRHGKRAAEKSPAPRVKVTQDGGKTTVNPDHPDRDLAWILLADALATNDFGFIEGLLEQLTNAASRGGKVSEKDYNFLLSVIKDIEPRDQLETMLASQMAVVHAAIMTFARRLANVDSILQQDSAERAFNKLVRTFAMQLEALKRYRTGGEQKVTVQHVTVSDGGQAIVGNVTQASRAPTPAQDEAKSPALPHQAQTPMTILDPGRKEQTPVRRRRKDGGRSSP